MYISKEKYAEIAAHYNTTIITPGDAAAALMFAYDLLIAEADAIKEREPYATNTIRRLKEAAREVYQMQNDVEEEYFNE